MSAQRGFSGFVLRQGQHEIALHVGDTLIGRSSECAIVLDGALVSRRHAVVHVTTDKVILHDLDSRNGTAVNGKRIQGQRELKPSDQLLIGNVELQLLTRTGPRQRATREMRKVQTMTVEPVQDLEDSLEMPEEGFSTLVDEPEERTKAGHALELLGTVIDKFFALGKGADAKRLIEGPLNGIWSEAKAGQQIAPALADRAADYGVQLAAAMGDETWLIKVIDIFEALNRPLPLPTIDRLYTMLRGRPGNGQRRLATYVRHLQSRRHLLSAAETFALKRLEGVVRVASL